MNYIEVSPKVIKLFQLRTGEIPFTEWFSKLRDIDKASQNEDIKKAKIYWTKYKQEKIHVDF